MADTSTLATGIFRTEPRFGALLAGEFDMFVGVPDSEVAPWLDDLIYHYRHSRCFILPREDAALSAAAGCWLAGGTALVIMGMQGLAASIDALTSLCVASRIPLVVLSAWSADGNSGIDHKRPIGRQLISLLDCIGVTSEIAIGPTANALAAVLVGAKRRASLQGSPHIVLLRSKDKPDADKTDGP